MALLRIASVSPLVALGQYYDSYGIPYTYSSYPQAGGYVSEYSAPQVTTSYYYPSMDPVQFQAAPPVAAPQVAAWGAVPASMDPVPFQAAPPVAAPQVAAPQVAAPQVAVWGAVPESMAAPPVAAPQVAAWGAVTEFATLEVPAAGAAPEVPAAGAALEAPLPVPVPVADNVAHVPSKNGGAGPEVPDDAAAPVAQDAARVPSKNADSDAPLIHEDILEGIKQNTRKTLKKSIDDEKNKSQRKSIEAFVERKRGIEEKAQKALDATLKAIDGKIGSLQKKCSEEQEKLNVEKADAIKKSRENLKATLENEQKELDKRIASVAELSSEQIEKAIEDKLAKLLG